MIKKYADHFFQFYCHPDYYEDIKGDLEEEYNNMLLTSTRRATDWQFAKEVLLLFRPSIIRPIYFINLQHVLAMLQNYFKIGFRSLLKHRNNTMIHVFGLAIGLAAFLLINQYVIFEKSYEHNNPKASQLYRITTDMLENGNVRGRDAMTYAPAAQALENALPEIISSTTTLQMSEMNFLRKGQAIQEEVLIAADSNFLNLFNYPLLKGDPKTALTEPYSMVLTESYVKKYFGNIDPIGQTVESLSYGGKNRNFKVTGVIAELPENTHYKADMFVSISSVRQRMIDEGWSNNNYFAYVLLDEQADFAGVKNKLPALSRQFIDEKGGELINLQPVRDIHLHSDMTFEPEIHGSARTVGFLKLISIFILLIAWINYINLSTARAIERAKEVGMRKVVGARKFQLMGQFFTESFLVNLFSVLIALFLAQLALPYFNQLVGKTVLENVWTSPQFIKNLIFFFTVGTLITGIYPAVVLSSFKPIEVLKGSFSRTKHGVWIRKALVVFQFAASLALIAGTIVVYQQIRYMTSQEMGMHTHQVLSFSNPEYEGKNYKQFEVRYESFRAELENINNVKTVGSLRSLPGGYSSDISSNDGMFSVIGESTPIKSTVYINWMDDHLADALGLEILAGRNFDLKMASDSNAVLINESMLNMLNIQDPKSVVNKFFENRGNYKYRIVGVLADFNRLTLRHQVEPTLFIAEKMEGNSVVKLETKDIKSSVNQIAASFQEFFPGAAFDPIFLDQRFEKLYGEDQKFGSVFAHFSILAIFVAIMGLFGLASFLSLQRIKEVGVRKVLGASTANIIFLFFKDYIWLIAIGILIGAPLVYMGMKEWLLSYAFRIDFPWWSVILAMFLLMLLSFLTVSFQTYKIARMNPAETIRNE